MRQIFRNIGKAILMFSGILSIVKCNDGYRNSGKKATFRGKEIFNKDFIVLNDAFAKDKEKVYFLDSIIDGADVASFVALDENHGKDSRFVYYCKEAREGQNYFLTKKQSVMRIDQADPSTFTIIGNGYSKDGQHGYFEGQNLKIKAPASFESIDVYFSKDRYQAYYMGAPIKDSDGSSFEVINSNYAKDKNQYYYYGYPSNPKSSPLPVCSAASSLIILDYPYSKNEKHVFYENEEIRDMDASSLVTIGSGFARDNEKVFYGTKHFPGADAVSFRVPEQTQGYPESEWYSMDKDHVFYGFKKIEGSHPESFQVLGLDYGKDANAVYYRTVRLKNADPGSFKVYDHGYGDEDAEDNTSKFSKGKKVH